MCNLYDKQKYAAHIKTLKQALNHGFVLKEVRRVMNFNQKAWVKPYIGLNIRLKAEAQNAFEKDFFKLMINSLFWKNKAERY